jgi:hypothetical protein
MDLLDLSAVNFAGESRSLIYCFFCGTLNPGGIDGCHLSSFSRRAVVENALDIVNGGWATSELESAEGGQEKIKQQRI